MLGYDDQLNDLIELKSLVKEFFDLYLDVIEVSDSGREFHPIRIDCCRAMNMDPLNKLLKQMKKLSSN